MTEPAQFPDLWPDEPTRSQRPWVDDEPAAEHPFSSRNSPTASAAPLKISFFLLIGSTVAIFVAAVVSSSAAPNSPLEQIALAAHRASMFALLFSLFAVLTAYRYPAALAGLIRSGMTYRASSALAVCCVMGAVVGGLMFVRGTEPNAALLAGTFMAFISFFILDLAHFVWTIRRRI